MKKLVLFLLMSLLLLSTVSASIIVQQYATNYQIQPVGSSTFCSCNEETYSFTITNQGSYTSSFTVFSETLEVSNSAVVLAPQTTQTIQVTPKELCSTNAKSVTVVDGYGQQQQLIFQPSIIDCFATEFAVDARATTMSACMDQSTEFYITNTGSVPQTYALASPTTALSAGSVTLPAGETATIEATHRYTCGLTTNQTARYFITALEEDIEYEITQEISFTDAYNFSVFSEDTSRAVCLGEEGIIEGAVQNTQDFPDQFFVDADLPRGVSLRFSQPVINNAFWLNPGEEIGFVLVSNAQTTQDQSAVLEFTSLYGEITQEYIFEFTRENCYALDASLEQKTICQNDEVSVLANLANRGTKELTVSLAGEQTRITPNTTEQISIEVNTTIPGLQSYDVTTLTGQNTSLELIVEDLESCYALGIDYATAVNYAADGVRVSTQALGERSGEYVLDIVSTAANANVSQVTSGDYFYLGFSNTVAPGMRVNATLVVTHESGYVQEEYLTIEIKDDSLFVKVSRAVENHFASISLCQMVSYALLLIIIVVCLLLLFRPKGPREWQGSKAFVILSILLLIVAFMFVSFMTGGFPSLAAPGTETNSTTYLRMLEDTKQEFDFEEFFYDPDNEEIAYGIMDVNTSEVVFAVQESTFVVTPEQDWFGNVSFKLFASDTEDITLSEEIILEVLPVQEYTLYDYYLQFCAYINLVLLALLLVLLNSYVGYKPAEEKPVKKTYY